MPHRMAQVILSICFSFHMPLFFILSGYFMHPEQRFRWRKESKQLLLTYAVTALCVLVGVACMARVKHENRAFVLRQWGMAALYGSGGVSNLTLWRVDFRIGAIWFLLALFWARLLLHCFTRLPHTFVWVFFCFVAGYISSRYIWLPWSVQSGMCAVAFLYFGYLVKKYDAVSYLKDMPYIWVIAILFWVMSIVFFDGMSMAMNNYGSHPVLSVVGSISGSICIVGISQLLNRVSILGDIIGRIGQASLAILCVHLVEDNVFVMPYPMYHELLRTFFPQIPLVLSSFMVRLPIDIGGAFLLYYVPVINEWFYPQLAKRNNRNRAICM